MTKKNTTGKRAIWASGLSIILCLAMLIGTTFAWFSDTASNKNNSIQAGNLGITVIGYDAEGLNPVNFKETAQPQPVIQETNWEPGLTNTKYITITNSGTLNLKFEMEFLTRDGGLQPALWYDISVVSVMPDGSVVPVRKEMNGLAAAVQSGQLNAGAQIIYRLDYGMLESAGNSYWDKNFTADINVTATQIAAPDVKKVYTAADIIGAAANDTVILMQDITLAEDLALDININLNTNGYTLDLGSKELTFGQTSAYATYDIKGIFTNGTIVLNNTNGHFNLYGEAGTNANLDIQATYPTTAILYGVWGDIHVDAGARAIIQDDAEVGSITGDGEVLNQAGYPYGAVILEPGADLRALILAAGSGTVFYLKAGAYDGVQLLNLKDFDKKITLVGESRSSVFLGCLAVSGTKAATEIIVKNVSFTGSYSGSTKSTVFVSTGTVRLDNCYFGRIEKINAQQRTMESSGGTSIFVNGCVFDGTLVNSYFNGQSLKSFTNNVFSNSAKGIAGDSMQAAFMNTVFIGNDFNYTSFYYASSLPYATTSFEDAVDAATGAESEFMIAALQNNTNLVIRFALNGGDYYAVLDTEGNFVQYS